MKMMLSAVAVLFAVTSSAQAAIEFGKITTNPTECANLIREVKCDVNNVNYNAIKANVKACGAYRSKSGETKGMSFLMDDGDLVMATFEGKGVRIGQGSRVGGVNKNLCPATRHSSYLGQDFKFITFLDDNKFFGITKQGNVYYALPDQKFYELRESGSAYADVNRIMVHGEFIRLEIVDRIFGITFYKDIARADLTTRRENGTDIQVQFRTRTEDTSSRLSDSVFTAR